MHCRWIVTSLMLSACASRPVLEGADSASDVEPRAPAPSSSPDAAGSPPPATPVAPGSPAAPAAADRGELVARVVDKGPLGDGRCTQQSFAITPLERGSGERPAPNTWVHFEHCEGEPPPTVTPGSIEVGGTYRFVLAKDTSRNFPGAPMIVSAVRVADEP